MPKIGNFNTARIMMACIVFSVVLVASNGVIVILSTNQISNNGIADRWEATSASGSLTWTTGWAEISVSGKDSFVSSWGGPWSAEVRLRTASGTSLGDLNLAWDPLRSRFVFAALEIAGPSQPSVWYGYSTDAHGTSWNVATKVFAGTFSSAGWDYPSLGVDASGDIIVGAVSLVSSGCAMPPCANGYYSNISTDGTHFNTNPSLVTAGTGAGGGGASRIIATATNTFHAFVPTLNSSNLPTDVVRWQSSNGTSWTNAGLVLHFGAPANNSPPATQPVLYYAPLLTAQGFTDGRWTAAFQVNNGGFNNAELCSSDRGCGLVNAAGTDEFLAGTATASDRGYWVSYYTYSALPRTLPLILQSIYCPPGKSCIGATTYPNPPGITPTSWAQVNRCPNAPNGACYAAGDFQGIAANNLPGASSPFAKQSPNQTDLFQVFTQDPQSGGNAYNFIPNSILWVPLGSDISSIAGPLPPGTDLAYPPGHNAGVPDVISQ